MYKKSFTPNPFLATYIDRFYVLKHKSLPMVLPGTGLELLFHLGETLSVKDQKLHQAHIICPRKVFTFSPTTNAYFIAVRFKSGAFRHFTSIPYLELNDAYASVEDLWGVQGKELVEQLYDIDSITEKIKHIETFLFQQFLNYFTKKNHKWDRIIASLYGNYNTLILKDLSTITNLSYRQFERNFKAQFGTTAKTFQKITRLQDTVKKVLFKKKSQYLDIALDNGYFDQSHFIKEFQLMIGKKPTAYFTKENFTQNFYHQSINHS